MHSLNDILKPLIKFELWLPPFVISLLLTGIAQVDFLTFHTLAEFFTIVISVVLFPFVWATRNFRGNHFLVFLACGYFWVGMIDLVHTLVYKGMDLFVVGSGNLGTQFWITARYSEALLLLAGTFVVFKKQHEFHLFAGFGGVAIGLVAWILSGGFPTTFIEGQGLTDFKMHSEYVIILILLSALVLLVRTRHDIPFDEKVLISTAIVLTILAEIFFTAYVSVYGRANLIGHIFKIFSYWFIFQVIVIYNLRKPFSELEFQKMALDEHAIVSISDTKGNITYVNDNLCSISGYSREELLGQNHRIFKSGAHSTKFYSELWKTIKSGTTWSGEIKNKKKNGEYFWSLSTVVPSLDNLGNPTKYIAIRSDISERKAAEEVMRRFEASIELTQDAIFMSSVDTLEFFFANKAASELTGYTQDELLEMTPKSLNPRLDISSLHDRIRSLAEGGGESIVFRGIQQHKNGPYIPVEVNLERITPSHGEPHILWAVKDVTESRAAELKIAQLKSTLDSIQDPVYMFWPDTMEYFYINQAGVRFTKISEEDFLGHTPMELYSHFDLERFRKRNEALLSGKVTALTYEAEFTMDDGKVVFVSVLAQIIRPKGAKAHFVEIMRDISERKEIDRAKSEFISTISHELRTPLTSIKGSLAILKSGKLNSAPEKVQSLINMAYKNSDRLALLVNDILDVEKINSGNLTLRLAQTNLSELVAESIDVNTGYGDQHGVKLVCEDSDPSLFVDADGGRLMQVMANFLSNAVKFSPRGGKVEVGCFRHNENIRIAIKDYGSGIPEKARPTIYDRFTQADSSDERAKGGSGLGLNISKAIIEAHGGTISFISEVDKGTTFYVDLPEVEVKQ